MKITGSYAFNGDIEGDFPGSMYHSLGLISKKEGQNILEFYVFKISILSGLLQRIAETASFDLKRQKKTQPMIQKKNG